MTNKKGRGYEHDLANDVAEATDGELVPLGGGYNGATAWDVDMLIDDGEAVHVFELKRTEQDAYTMHWDEDDRQKDDLYGLFKFCVNYPRPTYPYTGPRFNRKELLISKPFIEKWPDKEELLDSAVLTCDYDDAISVTHAGNLRFYSADSVTSQSQGNDAQAVLDAIGFSL